MQEIYHSYLKPIFDARKNQLFYVVLFGAIGLVFIDFYNDVFKPIDIVQFLYKNVSLEAATFYVRESTQLYIWAICSNIGYILIPALYVVFSKQLRFIDMGLSLPHKSSFKLYFVLLIAILIPVFFISFSKEFQASYPFYRYTDGGAFIWEGLTWELLYAGQFLGVEFFFRGFLIHASKKELGINSVYFAMIPYVMIHFSKPLPECLGSIFAGLILGHLSYKTNSIWGGVFLHVCVAMSMDFLSMHHRGML